MNPPILQFVWRGEIVTLQHVPPTRTLLQLLREDLAHSATKEGCNEGDCGACTVVLADLQDEQISYSAVNSCIKMAHAVDGMALWTAADLAAVDGTAHPVQQALHQCHASQCGFCTPGFAMSLFGLYQNKVLKGQPVSRTQAQEALSGNLCRCTGYRPILDAAEQMGALPRVKLNEARLRQQLASIAPANRTQEAACSYDAPTRLDALLAARTARPQTQLVAGCTDVGLWVNKMHMDFAQVLDLTRVAELKTIKVQDGHTVIGAAVSLNDAFAALESDRPHLHAFFSRFAGLPVRHAGTLGGNIANGSPIGDSMPLLIALRTSVVLMSLRGQRELLLEDLYTGYRKNVMTADEVLAFVRVPLPQTDELLRVYKISKRCEDDISAVCLGVKLQVQDGRVAEASIGIGGVAATPVRARQTEATLTGQAWTQDTVNTAKACLRSEFQPISDMRASAAYRIQVLDGLMQRFWLESQGVTDTSLATLTLQGENA
ncbi:MAG: xanthine dehydrogenase small subunit [Rhodoferax sp.]|uniref:xanthine dehydrogenase small subunit n=1 Tax=Rhodoferax sp. TaxID=50421 RepID=UPI0008B85C0A|nr:xanthine dehydrogenase small subunit [Rhodoferax sp.]MDP2681134.1 xanthine dehydrogenase small subunit [Rhodoferax sp.]OGB38515.1 MAG: xanthine dehydrogenase small subunit [Burkholderiales bacterium RIFOXYC2_FULL_59_8]OGB55729.1 MAG: xanthine dehydrogenase small subunit [Burkholderiales bacterium RIFOXYD12_FULL_59_19]OGB74049.1 MAG: xanthine dehydrogenase small subunit [Burkholderiales bacterium RIFOXYC12_FULL_60_6]